MEWEDWEGEGDNKLDKKDVTEPADQPLLSEPRSFQFLSFDAHSVLADDADFKKKGD